MDFDPTVVWMLKKTFSYLYFVGIMVPLVGMFMIIFVLCMAFWLTFDILYSYFLLEAFMKNKSRILYSMGVQKIIRTIMDFDLGCSAKIR